MSGTSPTATTAATAAAAATNPNVFKNKITAIWNSYPGAVLMELLRLYPDGLLLGTALFAFVTQNFAYAMFSLIVLESIAISIGLNKVFSFVDLGRTIPGKGANEEVCRSAFQSPTAEGLANMFEFGALSGFPSTHMFVASSAISYVMNAMMDLKNELSALGPEYATKFYVGLVLSIVFLLIIGLYRFNYNCEGMGNLMISLLLGLAFGYAFVQQNKVWFGRESLNIVNIPLFKYRDTNGKPIYICPTSN